LKHRTGRRKAYEIGERQGRTGSPEDHWFEAERELRAEDQPTETAQDFSKATVEGAPPVEAVGALEAASDSPAKSNRSPVIEGLIAASDALKRPHGLRRNSTYKPGMSQNGTGRTFPEVPCSREADVQVIRSTSHFAMQQRLHLCHDLGRILVLQSLNGFDLAWS
jgi:hypothetical protein